MKLEKILGSLNWQEKNSFIKIIINIISNDPKNKKTIEKYISDTDKPELKSLDNVVISKIFGLIEDEYSNIILSEFVNTSSHLDILIDIIVRDGNCIMEQHWFETLYEKEIKQIKKKIKQLQNDLDNPKSELSESRKRDYYIYKECVNTAYNNDKDNNQDEKITDDELSILLTLASQLELSQEEVKLINYMIVSPEKMKMSDVVNQLKNIGVVLFSKKNNTVYIPDETVRVLRKVRNKRIADKHFRRILGLLNQPQLNLICKKHNVDRKLSPDDKIKVIIREGVSFNNALSKDIHKDGTSISDKKKYLNELWSKGLNLKPSLKGITIEDKINNLVAYFESVEKDEKVGISIDGYEKLLLDLNESLPKLNAQLKTDFELKEDYILKSEFLLDYNIKPRDVLDLIDSKEIAKFCKDREIKTRGNDIDNILDAYKDSENLYLENYVNFGYRDLNELKENGINIKEPDLGIKFEELTKSIFTQLGFNVDEGLRKKLNTRKDKIDILLNIDNHQLILIECKTQKEGRYTKFSSVSRQIKSYKSLAEKENFDVIKTLLIAPEFSEDFISETLDAYELRLSLITASSLIKILKGFKLSKKNKPFPYQLLLRDEIIADRVLKVIG